MQGYDGECALLDRVGVWCADESHPISAQSTHKRHRQVRKRRGIAHTETET